jgi:hypothetical protein
MEMRDWKDDWKIPVITKDMPKGKEVEAGSSKTSAGGSTMTKKPTQQGKPSQKTMQQKKGSTPKKDAQTGKKDNAPAQEEQGRGDTTTQETPSATTPQETGPPKRPIIHTGGPCKKAKAHKQIPEYTITEDDVNLVAERVQDHAMDEFEEAENQRGRIRNSWSILRGLGKDTSNSKARKGNRTDPPSDRSRGQDHAE